MKMKKRNGIMKNEKEEVTKAQFPSTEHTIAYMRNRGLLRQIAPIWT